MPPKRKCSSKHHAYCCTLFPNEDVVVHRICDRKIRRSVIDLLIQKEHIFPHSTFLCNLCAKFGEQCTKYEEGTQEVASKRRFSVIDFFDEFLEAIRNNMLSEVQLSSLSHALGETQSKKIQEDSLKCGNQYKNIEFLQTFSIKDWLEDRNPIILSFLKGCCGNGSGEIALAKTVESIYGCKNQKFVSPISFAQNLIGYYITGSKSALTLATKGSPCGSYTTIQSWIADQGKEAIHCPQDPDVVTFFDNNQVLEKKWKVEVNYKSRASVITTLIHIIPNTMDPHRLQKMPELSPKIWLDFSETGKKNAVQKLLEDDKLYAAEFRNLRNQYIDHRLKKLVMQLDSEGHDIVDHNRFCASHATASERYNFIKSNHVPTASVMMGEPCFENPCSYEAVEKVLEHVREKTGVGQSREWTLIGCDGLPYTLASRIIENTFFCQECGMEFLSLEDFEQHRTDYKHVTDACLNACRKYNNILMLPGLGHYEINMTKALFRLLWDVGLVDLAKLLGFNSPKAQASCKSANDHHKSWQILTIFMEAMISELLSIYIRDTIESSPPSVLGFYRWYLGVRNPNYRFMAEVVLNYCLALHVFRAGVRRNNACAINASKSKFSPLFFGLNMPIYMETFIRDSFIRVQCPEQIKDFLEANESYSMSGNESKGEGGDFILESKNRKTKMWIQSGVPDNKKWLNVCRCIDKLEKVRSNVCAALCMCEIDPDYAFMYNIDYEVFAFRQHIRNTGYLTDPHSAKDHTTLSGKRLDDSLVSFDNKCNENRSEFLDFCVTHKLQDRKKFTPIFVFPNDRENFYSIEKKTKSEISQCIINKLAVFGDENLAGAWNSVKNKKKTEILKFYYSLPSGDD